jgi:hypothetical protein
MRKTLPEVKKKLKNNSVAIQKLYNSNFQKTQTFLWSEFKLELQSCFLIIKNVEVPLHVNAFPIVPLESSLKLSLLISPYPISNLLPSTLPTTNLHVGCIPFCNQPTHSSPNFLHYFHLHYFHHHLSSLPNFKTK